MTGMSGLFSLQACRPGYKVVGVSFGESGMHVRTVKKGSTKKISPRYNYKLISSAILRAKTPDGAQRAAMKARRKLGELLRDAVPGNSSDPDIRAAILHVRRMEIIAKRKKKHLEQEKQAEHGKPAFGEEAERTQEALAEKELEGLSAQEKQARMDREEEKLAEEIKQMEQEMSEEMLREMAELSEKFMESEEELLKETMPEIGGFENVHDMSEEDIEALKRKHRNDEWRDIIKADMDYLKAKFYRLQQEKTSASSKASLGGGDHSSPSCYEAASVDICLDSVADIEYACSDVGAVIDTSV